MARSKQAVSREVSTFVALVRMLAEWNTQACLTYLKKGMADLFVRHTSASNVANITRAIEGKTWKAQQRLPWVHSLFSPLAIPTRDGDGDYTAQSKLSLAKLWDVLQREGEVKQDFRSVSDAAFDQGLVKRVWVGRALMYAVTADLPALERKATSATRNVSAASLMSDLRKFSK